ncbi:MAG: peptidoglycan DD-metalloendopeptidase family protein [Candidatus Aenigmarchaeota archaeon]|nr:peptidoglycan DD-metalloendopeptidase family protein [Candidatus Aenigmarchaeota archaeon]
MNRKHIILMSVFIIFFLHLIIISHAQIDPSSDSVDDSSDRGYPIVSDTESIPPEGGIDNKYLKECKPCENQPKPITHGITVYWPVDPYTEPNFFNNDGDSFWANRPGKSGPRWHGANDYISSPGSIVRAMTEGIVTNVYDYYPAKGGGSLQAVLVYNKNLDVTFVYGEISASRYLKGTTIKAGDRLGTIQLNGLNPPSSMLHFMVFKGKISVATPWYKGRPNPGIWDPSDFMKLLWTKYRAGCKKEIKVTPTQFMSIKKSPGNPTR